MFCQHVGVSCMLTLVCGLVRVCLLWFVVMLCVVRCLCRLLCVVLCMLLCVLCCVGLCCVVMLCVVYNSLLLWVVGCCGLFDFGARCVFCVACFVVFSARCLQFIVCCLLFVVYCVFLLFVF